jgi:hypothetical protein
MQPKGESLFTTETLFLLLNKLPPAAREANRTQGIKTIPSLSQLLLMRVANFSFTKPDAKSHSMEKSSPKGGWTQQLSSGKSPSFQMAATILLPLI